MPEEVVEQCSVRRLSVMDWQGVVDWKLMPQLSDDDIRTIYWFMNLSRTLNSKMLSLQRQGRLGTFASVYGQEAQAAVSYAIRNEGNIWLVPTFRENAVLVAKGVPMEQVLRYWGGFEAGSRMEGMKVLPVGIPVGSQLTHAVGIAMSMGIKSERGAAIAFLGDGATSEGEVHEAMNLAGVFKAPVVFFCQNNQYAISVPRERQTASKTLAQKAFAYGFEGVQVDGNDVFAVYRAVNEAVGKALNGGGPTFIEAVTYRLDNHTTADDWKRYRSGDEVKGWIDKEPVLRLRRFMLAKGIWDDEREQGMLADAERKVEAAVAAYEATPKPKVAEIFDYTFERLPALLDEQKAELVKFWKGMGEQ